MMRRRAGVFAEETEYLSIRICIKRNCKDLTECFYISLCTSEKTSSLSIKLNAKKKKERKGKEIRYNVLLCRLAIVSIDNGEVRGSIKYINEPH